MTDYTPEQMIEEIPFDVADWDDLPLAYPDGIFATEADFKAAAEKSSALPRSQPRPPHRKA